jgi:RAD50-interacting protein 1
MLTQKQFYVALWDELRTRAKAGDEQPNISSDMSYDEVKDRTSPAVGSDDEEGMLFDETISAYSMRRKASLDFLVDALTESLNKAFKPYITRTRWTPISDDSTASESKLLMILLFQF